MNDPKTLGTETVRWDLARIYSGLDDPKLMDDARGIVTMSEAFDKAHRGTLRHTLGAAINAYRAIDELSNKVFIWLQMSATLDVSDQKIKAKMSEVRKLVTPAMAEHLTFFDHEIVALTDEEIAKQTAHPEVAKHLPWIEIVRQYKPHNLDEKIDEALSKRSEFGAGAWSEFYDDVESELRFEVDGKRLTLTEALHELTEDADPERRARILKTVNDGLGGSFAKFSAQTLWMTAGSKAIEDRERKYAHPMSARNLGNRISDGVVEALHAATNEVAAPITRDWYRLKGEMLGITKMRWSDRNAKLRFEDPRVIPYPEALATVLDAYRSFSPTLAGLVEKMVVENRIDAPATPTRESGAYNISGCFSGGVPESFVFMSYLGSPREVMTLAHELGHACHGLLAGASQGALMQSAPTAYAETASIFGEMTTFNHLLSKLTDPKAKLALVAGKIDDMLNSATRQIGFSFFERELHGAGKRLSAEELDAIWLSTTQTLYGEDGDVFTYENTEHLWAYIGHFHRPFYVYGYAFGELLTQSLYAVQSKFGKDFEPMYLDLLRAGGTKDAVELLRPFGLDPTDPNFWSNGIKASMGAMTEEAKKLWAAVSS